MVFSSSLFLFFFLPCLLFVYFFSAEKWRNSVLLLVSLFFYAWGEPKNVFLMILSIICNYFFGFLVSKKGKKFWIIISVIFNLGLLFIFKYLNFSVNIINHFLTETIVLPEIALPIGISFYTFQIMSYVIDVYRGEIPVQKNILNLGLYVSFFPQLIAGPIVRYVDIEKQIENRVTDVDSAYCGFKRFAIGFSKKVLIADQLAPLVDIVFTGQYPSIFSHWIGIIAYALQIYFDFSGYSDMAIGLGKIFGFDFLENFNYPYISKSIQEFWRRWHISLSSWFRDYLYIPLGGSRNGKIRTYINLFIVFFVTGLWHGASFNFIAWGLFYAVFLIAERMGLNRVIEKFPSVFRHFYVLIVVLIGWVFFRADNLRSAIEYIRLMFVPSGKDFANFNYVMNRQYWFCFVVGICCSVPCKLFDNSTVKKSKILLYMGDITVILIFAVAICYMVGSGYSPFLYFRF